LNKEFLKGIQARERVVALQKIHAVDSAQLKIYRDSIIPYYQSALTIAVEDVDFLNESLIEEEKAKNFYKYSALGLVIVVLLQIIF
jgi:hypothetical protein